MSRNNNIRRRGENYDDERCCCCGCCTRNWYKGFFIVALVLMILFQQYTTISRNGTNELTLPLYEPSNWNLFYSTIRSNRVSIVMMVRRISVIVVTFIFFLLLLLQCNCHCCVKHSKHCGTINLELRELVTDRSKLSNNIISILFDDELYYIYYVFSSQWIMDVISVCLDFSSS